MSGAIGRGMLAEADVWKYLTTSTDELGNQLDRLTLQKMEAWAKAYKDKQAGYNGPSFGLFPKTKRVDAEYSAEYLRKLVEGMPRQASQAELEATKQAKIKEEEEQALAREKCPFQKGCEVVILLKAVEEGQVTAAEYSSQDRFVVARVVSANTYPAGWYLELDGVRSHVFSDHVVEAPPPSPPKPPVPLPTLGRRRCMNL